MKIHNTWFAQATYLGIIGAFFLLLQVLQFQNIDFIIELPKFNIFENFMISIQIITYFNYFQVSVSTFYIYSAYFINLEAQISFFYFSSTSTGIKRYSLKFMNFDLIVNQIKINLRKSIQR
ncbi:unnamed protein product [Paramecium primaurelia]|uniref:Transmembrane protein n=1 Tax=Paramecium primaurelia TaxID=5886 RepID=A0A8S1K4H1_PARPR|nr:unnamed protein product [Paramecium primaurelia]